MGPSQELGPTGFGYGKGAPKGVSLVRLGWIGWAPHGQGHFWKTFLGQGPNVKNINAENLNNAENNRKLIK